MFHIRNMFQNCKVNHSILILYHLDSIVPSNFLLHHFHSGNCLVRPHSNSWMWLVYHWPSRKSFLHQPNRCRMSKSDHSQSLCCGRCKFDYIQNGFPYGFNYMMNGEWHSSVCACVWEHNIHLGEMFNIVLTEIFYVFLKPIIFFLRRNACQMHSMKTAVLRCFEPVCLKWYYSNVQFISYLRNKWQNTRNNFRNMHCFNI